MKFFNVCRMGIALALLSLYPSYFVTAQVTPTGDTTKAQTVTPIRKAIADGILFSEAVDEIQNKADTPLTKKYPGITVLSIPQISKAYSKNRTKADKTYKGKWFLILGHMAGISEDSQITTIDVSSGARKSSPKIQAQFPKTETLSAQLSNLKVGEPIALVCQAKGHEGKTNLGMSNCSFFTESLSTIYPEKYQHANDALQGKEPKAEYAGEALKILALESMLEPKQKAHCLQGAYACMLTIQPILEGGDADIPQSYLDLGYTAEMLYE